MKVTYVIGANAYAVIELASGRRIDIKLAPGKSAAERLREYAADRRIDAEYSLQMADIAERAAAIAGKR